MNGEWILYSDIWLCSDCCSQLAGRDLRRGRDHLMWVLLQFISGSIQRNPVSLVLLLVPPSAGMGRDLVHLVHLPLIGLLYQPLMIYDDECGAVSGMRIGRGNWSTWRKPALVPLCPPQITHDLTWARTQAAMVGSWRPTTWAMAWPYPVSFFHGCFSPYSLTSSTGLLQCMYP
jgi:hypothetical protein